MRLIPLVYVTLLLLASGCGGTSISSVVTPAATPTPTAATASVATSTAMVAAPSAPVTIPPATATRAFSPPTATPAGGSPTVTAFSKPPAAGASAGGASVAAGIGTYCWVSICLDAQGPITGPRALFVAPGGEVSLATQFAPVEAHVSVLPAAGRPKALDSGDLVWNFPPAGGAVLRGVAGPSGVVFAAPSAPGRYVIIAFLRAQGGGDVSYGVLIEVR